MAKYCLGGMGKHFRVGWQNLGGLAWQNIFAKIFWEDQKFCHLTNKNFCHPPQNNFCHLPLKFLGHPTPKFFCHPSLHEIPFEFNLCTDWKPHFNTDYLEMFGKVRLCQPTPQNFLATPPPNYFAVTFQKSFTTHASKDFVTPLLKKIAIPPPKNILQPHPHILPATPLPQQYVLGSVSFMVTSLHLKNAKRIHQNRLKHLYIEILKPVG